jgi:xanthine dehydrogenase accessory factor
MVSISDILILIKGAGDLGTGVACRLHKAGFPVVMTELAQPLVVRRTVAFASAVVDNEITVEGITARRAESFGDVRRLLDAGIIPLLIDPETHAREFLKPAVLIDAVMAKRNIGTRIDDAPLVIALGPGFTPSVDCHVVIETNRGHNLGRVLWSHAAEPNTGVPGEIGGKGAERVLRASAEGRVTSDTQIGDSVRQGQLIAHIGDSEVRAPFDGVLRGLVHDGLSVKPGMKIGDVDPRARREHCFTISDKALAIGGGALEAILFWMNTQG